jgi:hypothetical protein
MQLLIITAFAADVTLTLSGQSGYSGDSITVSGTYDPEEWVTVKAIDADGNIVFIEPVLSEGDGAFSTTLIVPDIDAGTLTVTAGAGSDVESATFTVRQRTYNHDDSEDEKGKNTTISDDEGNTMNGTVEETDDGKKIEISRDDFDELAEASNGNVTFDTRIAAVTFSGDAVDTINGSSDTGDISLTVEAVDASTLSDKAQELVGGRPVYEFTLMAGDTQISDLNGTATVNIPYEIADGEDPSAIVVYYVDDNGNPTPATGYYNAETGTVEFIVTHFSVYAVGYNEVMFEDVARGAWYYDAVTFCAAREITNGTGDDMFSPDAHLTRGQFIVMLMRAYAIEADKSAADNFDDAGDTYYTDYLAAAKSLGITNGIGNNLFAPEAEITRQDMFTLLYRALDALEELPKMVGNISLSDFSDSVAISDYAEQAMEAFVSSGIISGSGGELDPLGNSTRAQMAQVLYNLLGL